MKIRNIISLAAGAIALYFYKKSVDNTLAEKQLESQQYIDMLLDQIEEMKDKYNTSDDNAPVTMSCTVKMGGITLNQLEIWLNIRNNSSSMVEIGDFRGRLFVGGIRSERVIPGNISRYKIPANSTIRVRLYARGDVAYPNDYNEVRRMLTPLFGGSGISIPNGTVIPLSKSPVYLDVQYLWYWSGGEEECFSYIPGEFVYKYASWTVGSNAGYNAGRENQQDKNPSYWQKYDTQPIDE